MAVNVIEHFLSAAVNAKHTLHLASIFGGEYILKKHKIMCDKKRTSISSLTVFDNEELAL